MDDDGFFSVLVIEGNDTYAQMLRETLELDYLVTTVGTFAAVKALPRIKFDAILLGLTLEDTPTPEATMAEFFSINPDAAIIVLTNYDDPKMIRVAAEYGADDYIVKATLSPQTIATNLRLRIRINIEKHEARRREVQARKKLVDSAKETYEVWKRQTVALQAAADRLHRETTAMYKLAASTSNELADLYRHLANGDKHG